MTCIVSRTLLVAGALALAATLSPVPADAGQKIEVSYQVICDDADLAQQFTDAIGSRLAAADLEITDVMPQAKLLLYVNQDVDDTVNPDGYSIAVAHLSNYPTYFVASRLLDSETAEAETVQPVLLQMLREDGFLMHLNVAHVDRMNEANITRVANALADVFVEKTRAQWE